MVVYVHGIGEHPAKAEVKSQWDLALFGKPMPESVFAYWADILHGNSADLGPRTLRAHAESHPTTIDVAEVLRDAKVPKTKTRAASALIEGLAGAIAQRSGGVFDAARGKGKKVLPLPGGLRRSVAAFFLKRFLKDVAAYFYQPRKRSQIQKRLRDVLKDVDDGFVLVTHSLGTVIAYEILCESKRRPRCELWVTLGSPLGIQEVQDVLKDFGSNLTVPDGLSGWHNFADRLDPVAIDTVLANDYAPRDGLSVVDRTIVNEHTRDLGRFNPHSAVGYLSHREVRGVVHPAMGFDSTGRFVVARDVAEGFVDAGDRKPILLEVLEPGYGAVDESPEELADRESRQKESNASLPERIATLKKSIAEIAIERTLGSDPDPKDAEVCAEEIGAIALRKYVAANLTADEITAVAHANRDLNVYAIWKNSQKRKLIYRSHNPLKADAGRASFGAEGDRVTWAVLDTGVRWDHPHFAGQTIEEAWDCTTHDDQPVPMYLRGEPLNEYSAHDADVDGHGTHVCGIVAGSHAVGDTTYSGVAPKASLISYKVLDDEGFGSDAWIIKAIDHIFAKNQSVVSGLSVDGVNLSLGGPFDATVYGCGFSPICKELRDLWRQGTLVCVAAGNEGQIAVQTDRGGFDLNTHASIGDPANLNDCIAVGSVNADKPNLYGVSWFSSRGPTSDGRQKPDVVAPGERIHSCNSAFEQTRRRSGVAYENLYRAESGTSMACPHVSGVLAAFLSVRREFRGRPDEVKQILLSNCNDLGRAPYHQGAGMPNLMKMLTNT